MAPEEQRGVRAREQQEGLEVEAQLELPVSPPRVHIGPRGPLEGLYRAYRA